MKTILLLDDEPIVMAVLRQALSHYRVLEATSGEVAIQRACYESHIDLLIADVALAGTSGVQIALHLRSKMSDLKVMLASGYPVDMWSSQDRSDLARLGPDSTTVLEKPFFPAVLLHKVHDLIGPPHGVSGDQRSMKSITSAGQ